MFALASAEKWPPCLWSMYVTEKTMSFFFFLPNLMFAKYCWKILGLTQVMTTLLYLSQRSFNLEDLLN